MGYHAHRTDGYWLITPSLSGLARVNPCRPLDASRTSATLPDSYTSLDPRGATRALGTIAPAGVWLDADETTDWSQASVATICATMAAGGAVPDKWAALAEDYCTPGSYTAVQSVSDVIKTSVGLDPGTWPLTEPPGACVPPGPRPKEWAIWWCDPPSGPPTWASPKAIWPEQYGPGAYTAHPADLVPVYRSGVRTAVPQMFATVDAALAAGNVRKAEETLAQIRKVLETPFITAWVPASDKPSPMSGKAWPGGFMLPRAEHAFFLDRYNAVVAQLVELQGGAVIPANPTTDAKIKELEIAGEVTTSEAGETVAEGQAKSEAVAAVAEEKAGLKLSPMTLLVVGILAYLLFVRRR